MKERMTAMVSMAVILGFFSILVVVLTKNLAVEGLARDLFITLAVQFVACVQYWVGSSNGSAKKTEIMADTAKPPPAVVIEDQPKVGP